MENQERVNGGQELENKKISFGVHNRVIRFGFFAILFFVCGLGFFGFAGEASAATYTVCASGCNETTIQGCSTNHVMGADDVCLVSAGTYNGQITWNNADVGTSGHPVTVQCVEGDVCTIDASGAAYGFTSSALGIDYLTLDGFSITNYISRGVFLDGISNTLDEEVSVYNVIASGGVDGVWVRNKQHSTYRGITASGVTGYGFSVSSNGTATMDGNTIGDLHITNGGISSNTGPVNILYQHDLTIDDDVTISDTDAGAAGISFRACSGILTMDHDVVVTITNSGSDSFVIITSSCLLNLNGRISVVNSGNTGLTFSSDNSFPEGSYINRVEVDGAVLNGISNYASNTRFKSFYLKDCSNDGIYTSTGTNKVYTSDFSLGYGLSMIEEAGWDGFSSATGISKIEKTIIRHCGGGDGIPINEGDAITGHTDSVVSAYNNLIYENDNTCFAFIGGTTLHAYNNTCINNGVIGGSRSSIWTDNDTGTVDLQNNIIYGGLPYSIFANDATALGTILSSYNLYYPDVAATAFSTTNGGTTKQADLVAWKTASLQDANSIQNNPLFVSSSDYYLQSDSPAIDAGTDLSITSDLDGNPIYGLPDIGAYEYQPPNDMVGASKDEIDIEAGARIYGDGKFRDLATTSGTTANLTVTPSSGSFPTYTTEVRPAWMDITKATDEDAIIWETDHKKWKESSTTLGATNTLHTVGDLTAGKAYSLRIDDTLATANITGTDCVDGVCTADELGKITFTYTGGYSDHTFDITDDVAPIITVTSPETLDTVSGDDTLTFTDSETTDPECSIDNSNWVNCVSTVTSFSDLTNWDDIAESDTFTLYMRDTDSSNNTGTANVSNLTKADTQAPVRSEGLPSSELSSGTTSTTLSLTTSETAVCKYSNTPGTAYADMTELFTTEDGIIHTKDISNLSDGSSYSYYVRCQDLSENANDTDYLISFSVASPQDVEEDTDEEKDLDIHSVKAQSSENSITITWKTDHNTKSTIRYGTNKNLKEKKKDNDKEKKHKIVLKDLQPNTKYYFRIKATDSNDNEDSSRIHSTTTKSLPVLVISNQNVDTKENSTENQNSKMQESESQPVSKSPESATPNICTYSVQSGDTLWSIAKQVYGDATQYQKIIEKNQDKYPDIETKLSIGQELSFDCGDNNTVQGDSDKKVTERKTDTTENTNQNQESSTSLPDNEFRWWKPWTWF
ncbi:MAG: fibronectin type III domain-containing protein [Candidatus Moranbacteria bacterium]|jgi:LysM repeat protein|nr:fibronectin type III domain-containing protein [Candidatus Moranbacteria bacterium]